MYDDALLRILRVTTAGQGAHEIILRQTGPQISLRTYFRATGNALPPVAEFSQSFPGSRALGYGVRLGIDKISTRAGSGSTADGWAKVTVSTSSRYRRRCC